MAIRSDDERGTGHRLPRLRAPRRGARLVPLACALLLAACGDATTEVGRGAREECGDGVKPCACGDTVVADHRLTGDVVCSETRGRCDVERFACTGLTLEGGVTLDGAGFTLVGPPVPSAAGAVPDARRDALYGVEFPATTHGAHLQDLEVRGFVRGVVFRNALVPCASDADCGAGGCAAVPAELAEVLADRQQRYCAGNVAAGVAVRHDATAFGEQLGLFGFSIVAPDPDAVDDVGGMNLIEGGVVSGIGDRGVHLSQARLNVVRDVLVEGSARENVHLLRGSDSNLFEFVWSRSLHVAGSRARRERRGRSPSGLPSASGLPGAAPNVFVEDSKRNIFFGAFLDGGFVHVVGASDGNRFVRTELAGGAARYDFETDVEEATGLARAPRDNLVLGGRVARTGPRSHPCVILDGATGTRFEDVTLDCGDEPPAPGETPVDVLVARDNPDPSHPNVFHVADCDPAAPDLLVARDGGVSEQPLVLEDRACRVGPGPGQRLSASRSRRRPGSPPP